LQTKQIANQNHSNQLDQSIQSCQKATKSEELLSGQLEQLNERMNARLSNTHDHAAQVHALQDEVSLSANLAAKNLAAKLADRLDCNCRLCITLLH